MSFLQDDDTTGDDGFIVDEDHQSGVLFSDDEDEPTDDDLRLEEEDELDFLDDEDDFEDGQEDGYEEDEYEEDEYDEEGENLYEFEEDEDPIMDELDHYDEDDFIDSTFEEEDEPEVNELSEEIEAIKPEEAIHELGQMASERELNKDPLIIPDDIKEKFSDYVALIQKSESMNDEERQYWIDVLPSMEDEQLKNLKNILSNEQKQIKEAEGAYQSEAQGEVGQFGIDFDENKYREKKETLRKMEIEHEKKEVEDEEALLQEIENM